uniref:Serine palmitoyltransferase small subunit B n=1 Tax=Anolis carolinensis TaxID=28377 RepID=A0A803TVF2_ANOCA
MKCLKDYIYYLYFQYMLITCCIDFEPWEQMIAHVVTVTLFSILVFTAYIFIPLHLHLAFQFFLQS